MEIRFAKIEDVPGILALLRQIGQVHHRGRPDIFQDNAQKYGASQVIALLDKPNTPVFVAAENDKLLGYCFCLVKEHFRDPVIANHTELYIDDLCVDEDLRGQQIGKALFDAVCRYARQRGCYNVTLNVWSFNENALRFYEHRGMHPQKVGMELILEDTDAG